MALNRAVAVAHVHGPQAGLDALEAIPQRERLDSHYLLHAVAGELHWRLKNHRAAAESFRRALKLKPDDAPAKLELGRACERMGELACARPLLEDVASRFPDEVAPHVILARIYTRLNEPEKAEIERAAVKRIEKARQTTAPRTSSESRP